jgi:hypothetical protein
MTALLPDLLGALRARRRRRYARRAAAVAVVAALLALAPLAWWRFAAPSAAPTVAPTSPTVAGWATVADDPTILARCEVRTVERTEWLLSDEGLRAELRAAARPDGVVRTASRVFVSAAALDPWPGESP